MATSDITVRLIAQDLMSGNISKAIGSIDKLAKRGGLVGSVMQGVGQSFGQMLNPLGLITKGIGMVTDVMGEAVKAAMEDEQSVAKLTRTIENNTEAFSGQEMVLNKAIAAAQDLAFTDDQVRDSLNLLIPRTHDLNEAIRLNNLAMDLARFKGIDLEEAATLVGKAYSGQASALRRAGIAIDDTKDGTKALAQLQKAVQGQAKDYAKTTAGAFQAMNIQLDEAKESIGKDLLPLMLQLADAVHGLFAGGANDKTVLDYARGLRQVASSAGAASDPLTSIRDGVQALDDILQPQVDEAADFAKSIGWLGDAAGVTDRAIMDLYFTFKDNLGQGAEQAKRSVIGYVDTLRYTQDASRSVGTVLLATLGKGGAVPAGIAAGMEETNQSIVSFVDQWDSLGRLDSPDAIALIEQNLDLLRQYFYRLPPDIQRALDEMGIVAAGSLTRTAETVKGIAWNIPMGIVDKLRDGIPDVKTVMRDLRWAIEHPMALAKNRARILGALTGQRMVEGINSKNPAIRQAAIDARAALLTQWNGLPSKAMELGRLTINQLIAGLNEGEQYALGLYGQTGTTHGTRQIRKNQRKHRAAGGPVAAGGTYLVGERGPELLHMGASNGSITPNHAIRGGDIHVHFHGLVTAPSEAEGQRLARTIAPHLRREMARSGR